MSEEKKPQAIQLTVENAEQILVRFIDVAQKHAKGSAYELPETEVLVKAIEVVSGKELEGMSRLQARQVLVNGVIKGQKHGCYELQDAASLNTVVNYLVKESRKEPTKDDLSELSQTVPLKTREI